MAKKAKKSGGKSRRRRSRMSGIGENDRLMRGVAITAGVVAANYIKGFVKQYATIGGKDYSGAAPFIIGVLMPKISKNPIALAAADGMMAEGGASLAAVFLPSLPGMGRVDQVGMGSYTYDKILGAAGGNTFVNTNKQVRPGMRSY